MSVAVGGGLGGRGGNGCVAAAVGVAAGSGSWGEGWKSAFAETLEDTAGFLEEVQATLVLASGDESEGAGEHVGSEQLHAALDDGWVWGDWRG